MWDCYEPVVVLDVVEVVGATGAKLNGVDEVGAAPVFVGAAGLGNENDGADLKCA
jgi:hypothetical protein